MKITNKRINQLIRESVKRQVFNEIVQLPPVDIFPEKEKEIYQGIKETNTGFPTRRKDWNDFVGQIWNENEIANEESAVFLQRRDECIYMNTKNVIYKERL